MLDEQLRKHAEFRATQEQWGGLVHAESDIDKIKAIAALLPEGFDMPDHHVLELAKGHKYGNGSYVRCSVSLKGSEYEVKCVSGYCKTNHASIAAWAVSQFLKDFV